MGKAGVRNGGMRSPHVWNRTICELRKRIRVTPSKIMLFTHVLRRI